MYISLSPSTGDLGVGTLIYEEMLGLPWTLAGRPVQPNQQQLLLHACTLVTDAMQEYIFSFEYDKNGAVSMKLTSKGRQTKAGGSQAIFLTLIIFCSSNFCYVFQTRRQPASILLLSPRD